jgi:hypothetical protein
MVHLIAKTRYGGLNEYKKNTYGFARVFRAILTLLEQLSNEWNCSPEGALALIARHLQVGEFEPVDEPVHLDMRQNEDELKEFLGKSLLGSQLYLLQVADLLLRLDTRDGFKALELIELARIDLRQVPSEVKSVETVSTKESSNEDAGEPTKLDNNPVSTKESEQPSKRFKTRKRELAASDAREKPTSKPVKKESRKIQKEVLDVEPVSKLDEAIKRGQDAVARSKETLAQSGQVVTTNPLLTNFL